MLDSKQRLMMVEAYVDMKYFDDAQARLRAVHGEPTRENPQSRALYWDNVEGGATMVGLQQGTKATVRYLSRELIKQTTGDYKEPLDFGDQ